MTEAKSLAGKLVEIMAEVETVAKRGKNEFHKYDYATESDISAAIRKHLIERKLLILPRVSKWATMDKPGDKGQLVYVDMVFTIHDAESGEAMDFPWLGCGEDKGDKGLYKSYTGAEKYFLLKLFLIPTGDDPERDDPKKKAEAKKPEPKGETPKAPQTGETLTGEEIDRFYSICKKAGYRTHGDIKQFLTPFGADTVSKVQRVDYQKLLVSVAPDLEAVAQ